MCSLGDVDTRTKKKKRIKEEEEECVTRGAFGELDGMR